jgi:hypothetical protein
MPCRVLPFDFASKHVFGGTREQPFDPNRRLTYSSDKGSPIATRLAQASPLGGVPLYVRSDPLLTILEFANTEILMAEQPTPIVTRRPKTSLKIERRAWLRLPNEQDVICHPVLSGPQGEPELAWLGKVRDVSRAGIGLSISRRFEPGVELIVELSAKPSGVLNIPVRVVHATPDKKGLWILGCEFIFPLRQEELHTLIRE